MLSSGVFKCYHVVVLLFALFAGGLQGQPVLPSVLTTVAPLDNHEVAVARKGERVFADAQLTFHRLPQWLKGMSFVRGSRRSGCTVSPLTAGQLVVVTPAKGSPGSQAIQLETEGFEPVNESLTALFSGQQDRLQMYKKQVGYKSFRLSPVSFNGWVIVFFAPGPLPAHQVPATVTTSASPAFSKPMRQWQGCPSIEKTGSRLWSAWFSGGSREPDAGNYGIIAYSDDDGNNWRDPAIIITHPDTSVRVMDPQLWKDPAGKLWIFWVQNQGTAGFDGLWSTWAVQLKRPEAGTPTWTKPQRLCNGLTRNKPIVLTNGLWLLPSYHWVPDYRSAVYVSADKGRSWALQGGPVDKGSQNFYEHMLVELKDKRLWLLQRNVQESYSVDNGKSWTALAPVPEMTSANSRIYLGRLQSGNLLLVYNEDAERKTRRDLTAFISKDEGKTWPYKLLIDERTNVSYPDVAQDVNGTLYLCYDRGRATDKEIILATFREDDIIKGKLPEGYSPKMISKVK